jgi:hypothetical protein
MLNKFYKQCSIVTLVKVDCLQAQFTNINKVNIYSNQLLTFNYAFYKFLKISFI